MRVLRAPARDGARGGTVPEGLQRRGFSDRMVVAVAAGAPWPPAEGRYLNDAELEQLYGGGG